MRKRKCWLLPGPDLGLLVDSQASDTSGLARRSRHPLMLLSTERHVRFIYADDPTSRQAIAGFFRPVSGHPVFGKSLFPVIKGDIGRFSFFAGFGIHVL